MNITDNELFAAITPILLALHEKKLIDIAEIPHYYEDAVQRRKDMGVADADLDFQKQLVLGTARLALLVKAADQNRPT